MSLDGLIVVGDDGWFVCEFDEGLVLCIGE